MQSRSASSLATLCTIPLAMAMACLVGCGGPPEAATLKRGKEWDFQRVDLWARPPVDQATHEPAEKRSAQFGSQHGHETAALQVTGVVQGLAQRPGTVLVKDLELGRSSTFQFNPLPFGSGRCDCTFRVSVEERETPSSRRVMLAEHDMPDDVRFGAQKRVVSLAQWDGKNIRLVLEIKENTSTDSELGNKEEAVVLWANPEVTTLRRRQALAAIRTDQRPNVLLIVADTLRADALGTWGREPSVTPTLDALAAQSQVWMNAFSSLNATNPSFASLFTGLYAKNHGIYDFKTFLPKERTTLAERFQAESYRTLGAFAARHLGRVDLDQGFDDTYKPKSVFTGGLVVDQTMRWLDFYGASPFFAMVHLFDAHMPHTPAMPFAEGYVPQQRYGLGPVQEWKLVREPGIPAYEKEGAGGGATDLYLAEVAYLDRQIDRLLGYLEARGLLDHTIVVFTADHGENLIDHGIQFDHRGLYDTTTHVPLMIRWPGGVNPGTNDALVQNMDYLPTVLAGAGLSPQPNIDAVSLLTKGEQPGRRAVFSEHANHEGESLRTSDYRWTEYHAPGSFGDSEELFNLGSIRGTAGTKRNALSGEENVARNRLATALEAWRSHTPYVGEVMAGELDEEAVKQLQNLGYVVN